MTHRVLSVWLPNWPVQRIRAASGSDAHNANRPIVLISRDPRRGQLVVACCRRANRLGIQVGMSGGEAASLLDAAPDTHGRTEPHDSQADLEALHWLAEACRERFSPMVALDRMGPRRWSGQLLHMPDGLLMDVTSIGRLFGSEQALCRQVDLFFRERKLRVSIALASNVASAWGLARSKTLSQIAASTNCHVITRPDNELKHLLTLPTHAMRLEPACVETLARLGIYQFGALLRLPREGLATRFGPALMQRIDELLGNVDEPLPTFQHQPENSVHADLDCPTIDRDILERAIACLIDQLSDRLSTRGHGALQVVCRCDLLQHEPICLRVGLFSPTADARHLERLLADNLSRVRLPTEVHRIGVTAVLTGPLMQRQTNLIDDAHGLRGTPQSVANLVDNLAGRLGRESVLGVQTTRNPLPEHAYHLQPLTGQPVGEITRMRRTNRKAKVRKSASASKPGFMPSPEDPLRRPLQMAADPIKLRVVRIDRGKPPLEFRWRGNAAVTRRFWGPERIETQWWQGPCQRRDYFRIDTTGGSWLWIYRTLTTNDWYLHGWFC